MIAIAHIQETGEIAPPCTFRVFQLKVAVTSSNVADEEIISFDTCSAGPSGSGTLVHKFPLYYVHFQYYFVHLSLRFFA